MPLNERWGDYVPRKDELPPRRRPVLARFAIMLLVAFETIMLGYLLVVPSARRLSDLVGIWVLGSMIILSILGFALGETTSDMADLGSRAGRWMRALARRR